MEPRDDDITDLLSGDETLRQSIEKADQAGQWRDPSAAFVDPKLEALKKQLSETQAEIRNYTARRLRELQQRQAPVVAPAPVPVVNDWRETVVDRPIEEGQGLHELHEPFAPRPVILPPRESQMMRFSRYALRSYVASILLGILVFVPVAMLQALLTGWTDDLVLRVAAGGLLAGAAWRFLEAGRFRATMVGLGAHLLIFSVDVGKDGQFLGIFVGLIVAMLLSGFVGLLREEWDDLTSKRP